MKNCHKLALLLAGLLPSLAASAKTLEQAYLDGCRKGSGIPVPISVVSPHVSSDHIGESIVIGFVVDATGLPRDVKVKSGLDLALGDAVVDAIKQWRFAPATRHGEPVAMGVVLPIKVVVAPDGAVIAVN